MRYSIVIGSLLSFVLTDKQSVEAVVAACVAQGFSVAVEVSRCES